MAAHFTIPASPGRKVQKVDHFLGVDLTNDPKNVDLCRSPSAPNMIRDVPGKVRKCMGYEQTAAYKGGIYGAYTLRGQSETLLIHAGDTLYEAAGGKALYTGMARQPSRAWQLGEALYIQDGSRLLKYDGSRAYPAEEGAYVPTLTIGKSPAGGGKSYEALNLISPWFTELFGGTADAKQYQLSLAPLDRPQGSATVRAWLKTAGGDWQETTAFSVDYTAGTVTFAQAPGQSPITGEDNVKITAARTVPGYARRVQTCRTGALFGVGGVPDRLFVGGNPDYRNRDWYSGQGDGTYWPDTGYSEVGGAASAIMGYAILNGRLACYKDGAEPERSVVLRSGELRDGEPSFPVYATLEGPGALSRRAMGSLENEPLCLTGLGVYALTTSDVTGERYSQNRSFYADGALLAESGLENAHACVFHDLYWLCVNGKAYILDGLQSTVTDRQKPYSTRQYAAFLRLNLPASAMWVQEGRLYFGTEEGKVYRFYQDKNRQASYNDDGKPIAAWWETPDLSGEGGYSAKSFRYLAARMSSAVVTGADLWAMAGGVWRLLKQAGRRDRYLSFSQMTFSRMNFGCDRSTCAVRAKLALRQLDKARFRLENSALNEPFGLMDLAVEYTEQGRYRR